MQKITSVCSQSSGEQSPLLSRDAGSSEVSSQTRAGSRQETANTLHCIITNARREWKWWMAAFLSSERRQVAHCQHCCSAHQPSLLQSHLRGTTKMSTQHPHRTCLPVCPGGREENITPVLLAVFGLNAITRNAGFPHSSLSLAWGWLKTTNRRPWYTEEKIHH